MWQGVGGGCQCCKSWCHWQEDCCRTITINLTNAKLMGGCICLVRDQSRRSYWGVLQRSPVCFQHHLDVAVSTRCCGSHMQTNTKYTMCTIPIAIAKALIFVSQTITTIYLCSVLTEILEQQVTHSIKVISKFCGQLSCIIIALKCYSELLWMMNW